MCSKELAYSPQDQSHSTKLNDRQGAAIDLYNPLSNSYGRQQPPGLPAPVPGECSIVSSRQIQYFPGREDLRTLAVSGRSREPRGRSGQVGQAEMPVLMITPAGGADV